MSLKPLLSVEALTKSFPVHKGIFRREIARLQAVRSVSFEIYPGEILGMVGESGCGKSTIGRSILRLVEPNSGSVKLLGKELTTLGKRNMRTLRRDIQMVFQDPYASLSPRKTVAANIGEALMYHGLVQNKAEQHQRVLEVLHQVGLPVDVMNRYPHEFSGGQQQRICIGRAIALKPKLIICDEAVSALDVSVQAQILHLLKELKAQYQLSYLFISHDLSVVRHLCDRVLVLYLGQIVEEGSVEEVFFNPQHPYTQSLLSAVPREHPREKKAKHRLIGEPPSPLTPPSGCPFHSRCPLAREDCKQVFPKAFTVSGTHTHRCLVMSEK